MYREDIIMYRNYEDVLEALISGKTSKSNATKYIYNYKRKKEYDLAVMWYRAKIVYEGEYESKNS